MKKMKKILLLVTCAFVLLGTTACGSRNDADNGADQSSQDGMSEMRTAMSTMLRKATGSLMTL